jgi:hypothetical protein
VFEGFYPPVAPAPALNAVKAGSAVPLKFSLGGDYYVWKTENGWAGSCRYLSLRLVDGTEHRAAFQLSK